MGLRELLAAAYAPVQVEELHGAIMQRVAAFRREHAQLTGEAAPGAPAGQGAVQGAILITYGDQFREPGRPPLQSLHAFLGEYVRDLVGGVHLLPFYPYSSDDGFSVIDYYQVAPQLGTWQDIAALGTAYRLVFDLVVNHVSAQSAWFQRFPGGRAALYAATSWCWIPRRTCRRWCARAPRRCSRRSLRRRASAMSGRPLAQIRST